MKTPAKITKADDEKRIAYGIVYEPNVPDAHGDFMVAEEIEKAAHQFISAGLVNAIDSEHDFQDTEVVVVESFVARKGDPDFPEGAWVMGVHFPDADRWEKVKKGEIGGFSFAGKAYRNDEAETLEFEIADPDGFVRGTTQAHDGHTHTYVVKFDENGQMLGGATDEVNGHSHIISRGTVTSTDAAHSHRFDFLENFK